MPRRIRVNEGHHDITLPDGMTYSDGVDVVLSDDEFDAIPPSALTQGIISDLGALASPGATGSMTTVYAGSNADTSRPNVPGACYWVCDAGVTPVNAVFGDIIFNATG